MRIFFCSFLMMFLSSSLVLAEKVVLGMSQDEVAITATFDGSNILIFGAIQRDAPIPETPLDVIVTVSGPSEPLDVRRKAKRFGIWVNTDTVQVDVAPSFYAIATSGPFSNILTESEDFQHKISINRAIRSASAPENVADAQSFTDAVIRIREKSGLYRLQEGSVSIDQQTLFRTSINMPANLVEGDYSTRIFITREGAVIDQLSTTIDVRKVGLERFLFSLSREQPLLYGLMSLAIAIFAGWAASAVFQVLRNR